MANARASAQASAVAFAFFGAAGLFEEALIRVFQPTEFELDWVSDVVLSAALGVAVYLWLNLRETRISLMEHERAELVIQAQLSLAEAMQRRLLPSIPPAADGFEWAAGLTPAGRIGGDFYDFVQPSPGTWVVLVADVSGKGVPAAMALTLLRSTFRTLAHEGRAPADLARRLSNALFAEWLGTPYVTCIVARFETRTRTLTYANAGHPQGLLLASGADRYLKQGGPPLGLVPDAGFCEERIDLHAGDVCILVTDGITEALEDGAQSPYEIISGTARADTESAVTICDAVMARALLGHGPSGVEHWEDDRTVVAITVRAQR